MEDLAIFITLNHLGSFRMHLIKFKKKKNVIYRLRVSPYMKNCDLGLENAALGLQPWAAFSRPQSQFFTLWTSQPTNNIHICTCNTSIFFAHITKQFHK